MDRKKTSREARLAAAKAWADKKPSGFESRAIKLPDGMSYFRVEKAGTRRLDFIPFVMSREAYKRLTRDCKQSDPEFECYEQTYFSHRSVGPSSSTYTCPSKTFDRACPICEHLAKNRGDKELYKVLGPKFRHLWVVIDITDEESRKKGMQIWDTGHWKSFGEKLQVEIKETENYLWADSTEGFTLEVRFVEKTFNGNKFFDPDKLTFKERTKQYPDGYSSKAPALCDCIMETSYDELKDAFEKGVSTVTEDEPDEAQVTPKRAAKAPEKEKVEDEDDWEDDEEITQPRARSKPAAKVVDDDDEEDEEDASDLDEKPASKNGKKGSSRDIDDSDHADDSWLDDEDEEEEEEPAKKTKKPGRRGV